MIKRQIGVSIAIIRVNRSILANVVSDKTSQCLGNHVVRIDPDRVVVPSSVFLSSPNGSKSSSRSKQNLTVYTIDSHVYLIELEPD